MNFLLISFLQLQLCTALIVSIATGIYDVSVLLRDRPLQLRTEQLTSDNGCAVLYSTDSIRSLYATLDRRTNGFEFLCGDTTPRLPNNEERFAGPFLLRCPFNAYPAIEADIEEAENWLFLDQYLDRDVVVPDHFLVNRKYKGFCRPGTLDPRFGNSYKLANMNVREMPVEGSEKLRFMRQGRTQLTDQSPRSPYPAESSWSPGRQRNVELATVKQQLLVTLWLTAINGIHRQSELSTGSQQTN